MIVSSRQLRNEDLLLTSYLLPLTPASITKQCVNTDVGVRLMATENLVS